MMCKLYIYTKLKYRPIIIECELSYAQKILNDISCDDEVLVTKVCSIRKKDIKYAIIKS